MEATIHPTSPAANSRDIAIARALAMDPEVGIQPTHRSLAAWEAMRLDETMGLADWWKDYADPTMRTLFAPKGPVHGCTAETHSPTNPSLPMVPALKGRTEFRPRADKTGSLRVELSLRHEVLHGGSINGAMRWSSCMVIVVLLLTDHWIRGSIPNLARRR